MSLFLTVLLFIAIFVAIWMGIVIIGNMVLKSGVAAGNILLFSLCVTYILFYVLVPH